MLRGGAVNVSRESYRTTLTIATQPTSLCLVTFAFGSCSGKGDILNGPRASLPIYFKGPQKEENVDITIAMESLEKWGRHRGILGSEIHHESETLGQVALTSSHGSLASKSISPLFVPFVFTVQAVYSFLYIKP